MDSFDSCPYVVDSLQHSSGKAQQYHHIVLQMVEPSAKKKKTFSYLINLITICICCNEDTYQLPWPQAKNANNLNNLKFQTCLNHRQTSNIFNVVSLINLKTKTDKNVLY